MIETLAPGTWSCALHGSHGSARPLRGIVHHVQPRAAGGSNTADNLVTICANGHDAVHTVMWELANHRQAPACARKELAMAMLGVAKWRNAGEPGSIHAFMG
jgi:hypothetical protein